MKHQYQDGTLCLYFEGEFDNLERHEAERAQHPPHRAVSSPGAKLDFEKVSFVDSTGIGYVLARYKQMKKQAERRSYAICPGSTRRSLRCRAFSGSSAMKEMREDDE